MKNRKHTLLIVGFSALAVGALVTTAMLYSKKTPMAPGEQLKSLEVEMRKGINSSLDSKEASAVKQGDWHFVQNSLNQPNRSSNMKMALAIKHLLDRQLLPAEQFPGLAKVIIDYAQRIDQKSERPNPRIVRLLIESLKKMGAQQDEELKSQLTSLTGSSKPSLSEMGFEVTLSWFPNSPQIINQIQQAILKGDEKQALNGLEVASRLQNPAVKTKIICPVIKKLKDVHSSIQPELILVAAATNTESCTDFAEVARFAGQQKGERWANAFLSVLSLTKDSTSFEPSVRKIASDSQQSDYVKKKAETILEKMKAGVGHGD